MKESMEKNLEKTTEKTLEKNSEQAKKESPKRKRSSRNSRQIVAMAGVVLLVLLYVATLVTAIADSSQSAKWFRICLFATFALPLVIWIYSWMHGRLTGKSAIGDPEAPNPAQAPANPKEPQAADSEGNPPHTDNPQTPRR